MKEQKILVLDNEYLNWQEECDKAMAGGWSVVSVTQQKVSIGKMEGKIRGGFLLVLEKDKSNSNS